jgi:plastocyanin
MLVVLAVAVAALVAALPATSGPSATAVTLAVNSDAFVITLTQGTKKVTKLKPGTYTFKLVDKSTIHNVHLLKGTATVKGKNAKGKSVDVKTPVAGKKTISLKVTLAKGSYSFVCDPHASTMKGTLTVG